MDSDRTNLTRLTVVGSTLALCLGLAVPAYACTQSDPGKTVTPAVHPALTLAGLQAKVDARIDRQVARLDEALARVEASTGLSDARKTALEAKIAAEVAALDALETKVDAETTVAAVIADLRTADRLWDWWGHDGRHHRSGDPGQESGQAVDAVWRGGSTSAKPTHHVVVTGRGNAVASAGHHGFGQHGFGHLGLGQHGGWQHDGSRHSGGHGGSGHR